MGKKNLEKMTSFACWFHQKKKKSGIKATVRKKNRVWRGFIREIIRDQKVHIQRQWK